MGVGVGGGSARVGALKEGGAVSIVSSLTLVSSRLAPEDLHVDLSALNNNQD